VGERSFAAAVGETFAAVPAGSLVVHEDSSRRIAISLNLGRAAERLQARAGDAVVLSRSGR
jgi:S-adenosylmethionine hydrolase